MKLATILDESGGGFGLEYDNTLGRKLTMRLEAVTYEEALREAREYLGIQDNERDEDGDLWTVN